MLDRVGEHSGLAAYAWVNRMPRGGQPVDVRRLVKGAAETADVAPAQIVGEDEDDVGLGGEAGFAASAAQMRRRWHQQQGKDEQGSKSTHGCVLSKVKATISTLFRLRP